jgi:hypothetical protein
MNPTLGASLPLLLDQHDTRPPRDDFAGLVCTDRAAREEILHRAYAIWEREGRPENRKLAHWLEAEVDVLRPR